MLQHTHYPRINQIQRDSPCDLLIALVGPVDLDRTSMHSHPVPQLESDLFVKDGSKHKGLSSYVLQKTSH